MYGVPKHLNLNPFVGATLAAVEPLEYVFYFRFRSAASSRRLAPTTPPEIGVEGRWVLSSPTAEPLLSGSPIPPSLASLQSLLGLRIASFEVSAPTSFCLVFETGHRLEFFDSDPAYETLSVSPGDVFI